MRLHQIAGPVGGGVVHDDDSPRPLPHGRLDRLEEGQDVALAVVGDHDDSAVDHLRPFRSLHLS